jgi:hypothetical protein
MALTFPLLHMQLLLREAAPHLGDAVVARFLLGGLSPPFSRTPALRART